MDKNFPRATKRSSLSGLLSGRCFDNPHTALHVHSASLLWTGTVIAHLDVQMPGHAEQQGGTNHVVGNDGRFSHDIPVGDQCAPLGLVETVGWQDPARARRC
jgi:hypothetical protein